MYEFDRDSLKFSLKQTVPEVTSPNFLEIHPSGKYLYSVSMKTDNDGNRTDLVNSFAIHQQNGTLELINQVPAHGLGACHVHSDKTGNYLFVSFYRGGSLSVFKLNTDGSIGDSIQTFVYEGKSVAPNQDRSHVHAALVSPDNKYVYAADLGTDKVMIYLLDQNTGKLTPGSVPWASSNLGDGPRHMTFHPGKSFFYLAGELGSTATLFYQDPVSGQLSLTQRISTLPDNFSESNSVADIHADPEGNFLYVSNRGHNSIVIYSVDNENGKLSVVDYQSVKGNHPRNFVIEPQGDYLIVANMNTDNVVIFKRDKEKGLLNDTGKSLNIPSPVCLKWLKL